MSTDRILEMVIQMSNFLNYQNVNSEPETVELNSESAKKLLEDNNYEGQRNIKPALVKKHLENIQAGQFFASQIAIGRFKNGRRLFNVILDGQHRLLALAKANTTDLYKLSLLHIDLRSQEECKLYYQMFNNKISDRTLHDLVKFKLSHSENKKRWTHPVELVQALPLNS